MHHLPVDSFEFTEFDCLHFSDCKLDFHFCIKFGTFLDTILVLFIFCIFVGVFQIFCGMRIIVICEKKKESNKMIIPQ